MTSVDSEENTFKKVDFIDPLHALGSEGDDDDDGVEFDVSYKTIIKI